MNKKTALLHYWLTNMRGGEAVFSEMCKMFPDADVFTHAVIPKKMPQEITSHNITESFIAKLPGGRTHCQKYLPLMPYAQKQWDFSSYDIIISSESGPVKGINKPEHVKHICYCHTPMRYLWDMYNTYYEQANICEKIAMRMFRRHLQQYDLKSSECVDLFIANSKFVKDRIKRIYDRDASVVYPPVDVDFYKKAPVLERKFFLYVGQLVPYKRPDIVVDAFSKLNNEKLVIVGQGPLKKPLQKKATENVVFCDNISKEELRNLYASAKALIFPGIEDFGIVPVEAQAAGCPVIAIEAGGTLETVVPDKTGVFIKNQSAIEILNAIEELTSNKYEAVFMQQHAQFFETSNFCKRISDIVNTAV